MVGLLAYFLGIQGFVMQEKGDVGSKTTCGRLIGYSAHGPHAFLTVLRTQPAARFFAIVSRNVAIAVTNSTKFRVILSAGSCVRTQTIV